MNIDAAHQPYWFHPQVHERHAINKVDGVPNMPIFTSRTNLEVHQRQNALEHYSISLPRQNDVKFPTSACGRSEKDYSKQNSMQVIDNGRRKDVDVKNADLTTARKRLRITFSPRQLERLEREFHGSMYVVGLKRSRLAEELDLEERHIKIWFQNRRMKFKRDQRIIERSLNNTSTQMFENLVWF
ncbi:ventral anterior homeobox 2-like [Xenia sp. Carnegie-2017]|uniref:ventral anterior homeobox 2-like n=1 Tax=Xenia sp. Carnegie-2017 TaxID=2897299 RepID=UPI001F0408EE|nr:ventral anterior homeobox 2-like [Xenia sp. Carnegie-2017]XP_046851450.1 ventral anterior homeobox 2-like [Xenia sp. Carnegie-2017]